MHLGTKLVGKWRHAMRRKRTELRRRTPLVWVSMILVLLAFVWATAMAAFDLGFVQGAATVGSVLILYSVPATLFDWPRITLADALDLLAGIVGAITDFIKSLFGW
jgi:multisubunit Na+/H+ antiporter MnhB subunit